MVIEENKNKLFYALIIFLLVIAGVAIIVTILHKGRVDNLQKQTDVLEKQTASADQNIPVAGKTNSANSPQPAVLSGLFIVIGTVEKIENNTLTVKAFDQEKEYFANIGAAEIIKREMYVHSQPKDGEIPAPLKDTKISASDIRVNDTAVVETVENLKGTSTKNCTAKRVIIQIRVE